MAADAAGARPEGLPDLAVARYDDPVVQRLVAEVQAEYVARYGGPDDARVDPREFDPPDGLFVLAVSGGEPVAMGGYRPLGGGRAELKRMYVVPAARRRGLARVVLAHLEAAAAAAGHRELVLNTGLEQPEAIALYESSGYVPVAGFGRYARAPKARFYGTPLSRGPAPG